MKQATEAYHATTEIEGGWGFDNQRDAFERGYEEGVKAERARIRAEIDRQLEDIWDGNPDGYVWFDDLFNLTAPNQGRDR